VFPVTTFVPRLRCHQLNIQLLPLRWRRLNSLRVLQPRNHLLTRRPRGPLLLLWQCLLRRLKSRLMPQLRNQQNFLLKCRPLSLPKPQPRSLTVPTSWDTIASSIPFAARIQSLAAARMDTLVRDVEPRLALTNVLSMATASSVTCAWLVSAPIILILLRLLARRVPRDLRRIVPIPMPAPLTIAILPMVFASTKILHPSAMTISSAQPTRVIRRLVASTPQSTAAMWRIFAMTLLVTTLPRKVNRLASSKPLAAHWRTTVPLLIAL